MLNGLHESIVYGGAIELFYCSLVTFCPLLGNAGLLLIPVREV
jgi:hypothetical protein